MSNMAIELQPPVVLQELGDVELVDGELAVRTASGCHRLRKSFSCLVDPANGDRVLVVRDGDAGAYVLAVLARTHEAPTRLVLAGDVELYAPGGGVNVCARDRIGLSSPGSVELTSRELRVGACQGHFAVATAYFSGSRLDACIDRIKLVAVSLDAVLDRVTQRLRQSLRRVEELDRTEAGQIDQRARDTLSLHGDNTLMTANHLVKVDGEQIHVG